MNYLQSLVLSKPQNPIQQSNQKKPSGVHQRSNAGTSQPVPPRASEIGMQNTDMIQAWVSGGSVEMPQSRVTPKNAGKKMDFFG
jgi:hypothetical protein